MNSLEKLYYILEEEDRTPDTPEYRETHRRRNQLMDQVEAALGTELMEELAQAQGQYEELECKRFFLHGVRFGPELLRL